MQDLLFSFKAYIQNEGLIKPKQKVLLAISGGMDSVVLAHLLNASLIPFELAHVNFQLRGEESERDESFVKDLASSLGVPLHMKKADTISFAEEHKLSIQEAARKIRYTWFEELLNTHQLDLVCTAHHADDDVETMLMNVCRGTGLMGMRGILPKQGKIIRPLLFASRDQIQEYATAHHLQFVEDSSNASDKYARNYIRHHIIPQLTQLWPEAAENLRLNMVRFKESEGLYREALQRKLNKLIHLKEDGLYVPVEGLRFTKPLRTIVFELFHDKGFSAKQVNEIILLLDAHTGSFINSTTHRIIKNRNWLICLPLSTDVPSIVLIQEDEKDVSFAHGNIHIHVKSSPSKDTLSTDPHIAQIDRSSLTFPLILRPWKAGDYFYPLGMAKKKKIARFLIDQKVPRHIKERVLVLESAGRICWVVGHRIDDRFKIRSSTPEIVEFQFKP